MPFLSLGGWDRGEVGGGGGGSEGAVKNQTLQEDVRVIMPTILPQVAGAGNPGKEKTQVT